MAVAPSAEISQFLDLGMIVLHVIFHRQTLRAVQSNIASKSEQDAADFEC